MLIILTHNYTARIIWKKCQGWKWTAKNRVIL